jgi:hypothetical protein
MSGFTDLVKKLNAISNNEETVSATGDTVYKPVEEAVAGTRETASILKVFNELEEAAKPDYIDLDGDGDKEESMKKAAKDKKAKKDSVKEANETSQNEDIVSDIRLRYADFLKSEVAQGNELASVTSAVEEGTSTASAISDSFDKMFNMMGRLMKLTAEGGVLSKMVDREGGDNSYVTDANAKLIEAMEALETANMYSQPSRFDEE